MSGEKVCFNFPTVECKIALHNEAYSTAVLCPENLCIITSATCRVRREMPELSSKIDLIM